MICLLQITLVAYLFYMYRLALQLTDIQYAIKQKSTLCGSRKYPYPPHGRSLEFPRGSGGQREKFPREGGFTLNFFPEGVKHVTTVRNERNTYVNYCFSS